MGQKKYRKLLKNGKFQEKKFTNAIKSWVENPGKSPEAKTSKN